MKFSACARLAIVAAVLAAATPGKAAAPTGFGAQDEHSATAARRHTYRLDTELVVRDWVLCVNRATAERLAHAREEGVVQAREAYAALTGARTCGRFGQLQVILRKRLYYSPPGYGHDARVFAADVWLSNQWANAFVVFGGVPAE